MEPSEKPKPVGAVSLYLRPKNSQTTQKTAGKIRCFIGGEWKPRSEFSNRQLEKFDHSRSHPGHSQISCRVHSTQIRREIKCEGPCAKWLPIENFSKATRSHSKTWCMDCTEWQLSVEPGYAPYVPPTSREDDEEDDEEVEEEHEIDPADEIPGERIEDWIQNNPSELGGYDKVETGTAHTSTVGSISDISGRSLLDTCNREIGGLPEALTATNLNVAHTAGPVIPFYASIASTSTVRPPASVTSQASRPASGGQLIGWGAMRSDTASVSQSNQSASNTLFSADSVTTQSQSVSGASTVWMESGFQALTIGPPRVPQRIETRNGWARPVQRKTDLAAPRYVATNGGVDLQPQNIQRTVYTDADDEGSEDEC
ncbi:hypothetical protein SEUCBS139899_001580 [Sporothrix eucalyptigena]|uniref:Stc1 domain-containing protein n=1 Tax=Sporothrix eucalyptigena TaxID=1812306 RepID=A0ABP0BNI1_9PEZI